MAVRLRLRRIGKKKMPMYHIVAADSRAARSGKFLEIIGRYEPLQNPPVIQADEAILFRWLKNGALPTATVRSLLQRSGQWMKWSLTKRGVEESQIALEMQKWGMMQEEKRKRSDERKSRRNANRRKTKASKKTETPAPVPAAAPPAAQTAQ